MAFVTRFVLEETEPGRDRVRLTTPGSVATIRARGPCPLEPPGAPLTSPELNAWMQDCGPDYQWRIGMRDRPDASAVEEVPDDATDW